MRTVAQSLALVLALAALLCSSRVAAASHKHDKSGSALEVHHSKHSHGSPHGHKPSAHQAHTKIDDSQPIPPEAYDKDFYTGSGVQPVKSLPFSELPQYWNWCNNPDNSKSYCTASWNQHIPVYCGSCYIHGALAQMNDRIKLVNEGREDVILARQVILNCGAKHHLGAGCDGGEAYDIFEYLYRYGLPDESCQQYAAVESKTCNQVDICSNCMPRGEDITDFTCWPIEKPVMYYVTGYGKVSGEQAIMSEIYERGPVTCGFASTDDFDYNYYGGIFFDKTNATEMNHDIEVVGWGEEYDEELGENAKYWIVRNSWGTYWGENGFARIVRGINNMNFESDCAFALVDTTVLNRIDDGELVGGMYGLRERNDSRVYDMYHGVSPIANAREYEFYLKHGHNAKHPSHHVRSATESDPRDKLAPVEDEEEQTNLVETQALTALIEVVSQELNEVVKHKHGKSHAHKHDDEKPEHKHSSHKATPHKHDESKHKHKSHEAPAHKHEVKHEHTEKPAHNHKEHHKPAAHAHKHDEDKHAAHEHAAKHKHHPHKHYTTPKPSTEGEDVGQQQNVTEILDSVAKIIHEATGFVPGNQQRQPQPYAPQHAEDSDGDYAAGGQPNGFIPDWQKFIPGNQPQQPAPQQQPIAPYAPRSHEHLHHVHSKHSHHQHAAYDEAEVAHSGRTLLSLNSMDEHQRRVLKKHHEYAKAHAHKHHPSAHTSDETTSISEGGKADAEAINAGGDIASQYNNYPTGQGYGEPYAKQWSSDSVSKFAGQRGPSSDADEPEASAAGRYAGDDRHSAKHHDSKHAERHTKPQAAGYGGGGATNWQHYADQYGGGAAGAGGASSQSGGGGDYADYSKYMDQYAGGAAGGGQSAAGGGAGGDWQKYANQGGGAAGAQGSGDAGGSADWTKYQDQYAGQFGGYTHGQDRPEKGQWGGYQPAGKKSEQHDWHNGKATKHHAHKHHHEHKAQAVAETQPSAGFGGFDYSHYIPSGAQTNLIESQLGLRDALFATVSTAERSAAAPTHLQLSQALNEVVADSDAGAARMTAAVNAAVSDIQQAIADNPHDQVLMQAEIQAAIHRVKHAIRAEAAHLHEQIDLEQQRIEEAQPIISLPGNLAEAFTPVNGLVICALLGAVGAGVYSVKQKQRAQYQEI